MAKMIGVRISQDLLNRIDSLASAERQTRAEIIRALLESALTGRTSELVELQTEVAQAKAYAEAVLRVFRDLLTGPKQDTYLAVVARLAPEVLEEA
jgi:metal-responsive CopG/Arc/MetJ family transcriptional regulator